MENSVVVLETFKEWVYAIADHSRQNPGSVFMRSSNPIKRLMGLEDGKTNTIFRVPLTKVKDVKIKINEEGFEITELIGSTIRDKAGSMYNEGVMGALSALVDV